jgi:hypothetical protein
VPGLRSEGVRYERLSDEGGHGGSSAPEARAGSTAAGLEAPGLVAVPVVVTALTLVPFIVTGDVPGMELLHTAAAVILGGLATTALVCLVVLPVATRLFGRAPAPDSDDALAGIAMASGAGAAGAVTVPSTRPPAEALDGQMTGARGPDVEHAFVRDNPGGRGGNGSPHRPGTDAGPPADAGPSGAGRFREGA